MSNIVSLLNTITRGVGSHRERTFQVALECLSSNGGRGLNGRKVNWEPPCGIYKLIDPKPTRIIGVHRHEEDADSRVQSSIWRVPNGSPTSAAPE
jgi:hypothetical protein